jgi:hypothetical protein
MSPGQFSDCFANFKGCSLWLGTYFLSKIIYKIGPVHATTKGDVRRHLFFKNSFQKTVFKTTCFQKLFRVHVTRSNTLGPVAMYMLRHFVMSF